MEDTCRQSACIAGFMCEIWFKVEFLKSEIAAATGRLPEYGFNRTVLFLLWHNHTHCRLLLCSFHWDENKGHFFGARKQLIKETVIAANFPKRSSLSVCVNKMFSCLSSQTSTLSWDLCIENMLYMVFTRITVSKQPHFFYSSRLFRRWWCFIK